MTKIKKFLKFYRAPLLSGVLLGCSFIPFPFFALLFSLAPLWFFIYRQTHLKRVIVGCFLCQFISTLIGFNWVIYTFHNFGGMNWFLSFIFLLGFSGIANLYLPLSGALWFLSVQRLSWPVPSKLILFPLIFSVLHSWVPTVFPWNMGYPWLWGGLWGAQTAELWGFRFLNTLFYVFNLLFLILYQHCTFKTGRKTEKSSPASWPSRFIYRALAGFKKLLSLRFDHTGKMTLTGAIVLFVFLNGLGLYLKKRLPPPDQFLNMILIQNNIGSVFYLDPKPFKTPERKSLYISRTLTYRALKSARKQKLLKGVDLILWSEGSYPYTINKRKKRDRRLSRMVKTIQIPLITGAMSKEKGKYGNSLFVFDREGNILKPVYDKTKLLIFGEYFPGIDRFPFLRKLFPYFGANMAPGKEVQVQELEGRRFGWQICYESLFDRISRTLANKQAQILVNITNDSWYGGAWQEPYQHLTMNFARAIEVRRPLIRATNTGYSGVIHANGDIDRISPFNKAWFYLYKVPYYKNPPKTLFMGWGYYINEMFLFLLALLSTALFFKPLYRRHSK